MIEILGVPTTETHLRGALWSLVVNFIINGAGFCIAAHFIAVWAAALAYWRWSNVDTRWTTKVTSSGKAT